MKNKINIGVVGLGMGTNILSLNEDENTDLYIKAICDIKEEKVNFYKDKYDIELGFTDYSEMLKVGDIDVIAIYTPDRLHYKHCTLALIADKNVICTKPMTTSNK